MKYYSHELDKFAIVDDKKQAPKGQIWLFLHAPTIKDDKPTDSVLWDYDDFVKTFTIPLNTHASC